MRLLDHDEPIDPEIAASLDAIDAVLAGEPVDAQYAELAELALLLTAERPPVPPAFVQTMDKRVSRRFATPHVAAVPGQPRRRRLSTGFWEAAGALSAGVALIVGIVIVAGTLHSNGSSDASSTASVASAGSGEALSTTSASAEPTTRASAGASAPAVTASHGSARSPSSAFKSAASVPSTSSAAAASSSGAQTLQPPTTGRKVVQSAQLQLGAPPNRIDDVAQQVYDVIGSVNGIVENSTVTQTGGPDGSADFQLSVPSASLGQAMSQLSSLNYASVLSRTDASTDITDTYGAAQRALADARALRTSLLKQLANAVTTEQVDSLNAQIHDAEASISSDEATLARLNHEVGFSQLSLQISARNAPAPVAPKSGGFGIGRAAHDAGRVLTVAAGVALIAIAGLTPVALVAALLWWVGAAVRRRRREQALDSA
ncbi:MAG: DUF4349 domain-containing protein [Solirubrobacterales bacterium]|nr:DUF4349 domain-containing protein [Solirubrobacterales bacterium]